VTALSAAALRSGPLTLSGARTVRLVAFGALAAYAGAHWATIVQPAAQGTLAGMLVLAVAAGVTFDVAGGVARRPVRLVAAGAVLLAALGAVLVVAGAPLALLRPDRWGRLASEIGAAMQDLPALRVPYSGQDPWVHTVLLSGGGLLLVAAALLALRARAHSFAAAVCLGVLYTVPIVEHAPQRPWLDGAVFAVLLGVCLWGDRLRRREVPLAVPLGAVVVLAAVVTAPRLDSGSPWIDYESIAESLQSGSATTFHWNHTYGPVDWSRTGIELARVRTRGNLYLKTADLERFDGRTWRQSRGAVGFQGGDTQIDDGHPEWRQSIHVRIRGLRTRQFLGAGTTTYITHSSRTLHEATPGTFEVDAKPLRRGDSYDASVYVPRPSAAEMRAAGIDYPNFVSRQLVVEVPRSRATGGFGAVEIAFPAWGSGTAMTAAGPQGLVNVDPQLAVRASPYRRELALAEALRRSSTGPYDYVRRVIARVRRGARYTESPRPPGRLAPLDAFLFRDHAGYCQHFAGATALLLRMGGVPARVVAGFAPGSRAGDGEHVIRDFDAHSWVEAYFPGIGWTTFDPTPGDSPAREQLTDRDGSAAVAAGSSLPATAAPVPRIPGQARGRDEVPRAGAGRGSDGTGEASGGAGAGIPVVVGVVVVLALATAAPAVAFVRRRRRLAAATDPELEELRLALARTGRAAAPDMTLQRLERLLAGSTDARAYVSALRRARYGPGSGGPDAPAGPTPAQRRALRRELGAGLGPGGRLRAAWALPPRPREALEWLRARRRRPYTA
jgi:transglutaminase-like putative cysteine protease